MVIQIFALQLIRWRSCRPVYVPHVPDLREYQFTKRPPKGYRQRSCKKYTWLSMYMQDFCRWLWFRRLALVGTFWGLSCSLPWTPGATGGARTGRFASCAASTSVTSSRRWSASGRSWVAARWRDSESGSQGRRQPLVSLKLRMRASVAVMSRGANRMYHAAVARTANLLPWIEYCHEPNVNYSFTRNNRF